MTITQRKEILAKQLIKENFLNGEQKAFIENKLKVAKTMKDLEEVETFFGHVNGLKVKLYADVGHEVSNMVDRMLGQILHEKESTERIALEKDLSILLSKM